MAYNGDWKLNKRTQRTLAAMDEGKYINNRVIPIGGVEFSARDVFVKAPLIAGLNMYTVGGTGEGKTELATDVLSYFGGTEGSGVYVQGRPDFEPSELFRMVNMEAIADLNPPMMTQIKQAMYDFWAQNPGMKAMRRAMGKPQLPARTIEFEEIEKLTANVNKTLFYVDEMNRTLPLIMNYFFDFMDGRFSYKGQVFPLGQKGYSVGFASGNFGNGEYLGTSDTDRALMDRMHLIVKMDDPRYSPTSFDKYQIFGTKFNPRASTPRQSSDLTDDIIAMHEEFKKRMHVDSWLPLIGVYLTDGLDYVMDTVRHSKKALNGRWDHAEGVAKDNDESRLHPLSTRSIFSAMSMAKALEFIALYDGKIEGSKDNDLQAPPSMQFNFFMDSLQFTVPFSGVISPAYIDQHNGDVYSAFDELLGPNSKIRTELAGKRDSVRRALLFAKGGYAHPDFKRHLQELGPDASRWGSVKNTLESLLEHNHESNDPDVVAHRNLMME